jgi:hypothetical protein
MNQSQAVAARWWQSLLDQEDGFGDFTQCLADVLMGKGAPSALCDRARQIVDEERHHVELCERVIEYLGAEVRQRPRQPCVLDSEQSVVEAIVVGFAVGETMSVGGFVASLAYARDPFVRNALKQLIRDEVRHGQFGELAGNWVLRDWSIERRQTLWSACVSMMESFERRCGGVEAIAAHPGPFARDLGAPPPSVTHRGMLRAVERTVLPRLSRLGVVPACSI